MDHTPVSEDRLKVLRDQIQKDQRDQLLKDIQRYPEFSIDIHSSPRERFCHYCYVDFTTLMGYRACVWPELVTAKDQRISRGARLGIFHIKCLEDILDLGSPAILPHITQSRVGSKGYLLDIGAAEIVTLWYEKCNMDNTVATAINATTNTASEVVGASDEGISSTEPITNTSSSASAPTPSVNSSFQWQGHDLVYLPDLKEKGSVGVESHSWYHDRDALLVPWSKDIVTDKLPRLPSNGGYILKDDLTKHFKQKPLQLSNGDQWSILSYLPHDPSQWGAKHALSESLERWWRDRKPKSLLQGSEDMEQREKRLGSNVSKRIRELCRKVEPHPDDTEEPSEDPSQE